MEYEVFEEYINEWCMKTSSIPDTKHCSNKTHGHYSDVIMSVMSSQITGVWIVYSTVCLGVDERKHKSSASLVFVIEIHRWPVNSPHKGPVTQKMLPFDDVIMVEFHQANIMELYQNDEYL